MNQSKCCDDGGLTANFCLIQVGRNDEYMEKKSIKYSHLFALKNYWNHEQNSENSQCYDV